MSRYLIIVSRHRPDLFGNLAITFGRTGEVDVRFDRRQGQPWTGPGDRPERRARSSRDWSLRVHGFVVIRRPTSAPRPAASPASAATH